MSKISDLDTPCVLVDIDRVEANLARAQAHANANGYKLRPHIKTHKLPRFAQRAIELGAVGITVQKLGEAEVMADAGITNIFLPYNIVGPAKLARLKALNARVVLAVTADSPDTVAGYAATFPRRQAADCAGRVRYGRRPVRCPIGGAGARARAADRDGAGTAVRRADDLSAARKAGSRRSLAG